MTHRLKVPDFYTLQLGADIRLKRSGLDLSLNELAKRCQCNRATITDLENKRPVRLHVSTFIRLCYHLTLDPLAYMAATTEPLPRPQKELTLGNFK